MFSAGVIVLFLKYILLELFWVNAMNDDNKRVLRTSSRFSFMDIAVLELKIMKIINNSIPKKSKIYC
jgi:hypothetical protein